MLLHREAAGVGWLRGDTADTHHVLLGRLREGSVSGRSDQPV
jgi:hypothetical protein